MTMLGRTSWMVAAFFALVGCTIENSDHCYFQKGDDFCRMKYGEDYVCNQCTASNNGCVTEIDADLEDKCHAVTVVDTESTSELTNADSTVTASSSMSSTTMGSMSGDATTSPTSTTTSADSSTTSSEESSSTDAGSSSSESTGVVGPVCGNDLIEGKEICDGTDLGEATDCAAVMLGSGEVACNADCTLNLDGCSGMPECGNDLIEGNEQCEGLDLAGDTCESLDYVGGTLTCAADCAFDVSACESCGNGYIDLDDNCDGTDLNGQSCDDFSFFGGQLACDASCNFDTSGCNMCGNGAVDVDEDCEGPMLNGGTCMSEGFADGDIACNDDCTFDTSDCCYGALHGCGSGADCCSGNCGLIGLDLVCL